MKRNKFVQNHVKERYITSFNSIFNSCGLVGLSKFVFLGLGQNLDTLLAFMFAGAHDEQKAQENQAAYCNK